MAEAAGSREVVVVGGGIAGLAAAHALQKHGVPFVLLESSPRWGGLIRTDRVEGFLIEGGPDSILAQKPEALALCRELGLGERLVPTNPTQRTVYVLRRGRLHALPEGMALAAPTRVGPFLRSRLFSWRGKLRMGLDLVIPARRDAGDESIASFLRRRLGREAVELVGDPLMAGIHAGDPERLSIRATFPRFVELEKRHGSLIRGLRASDPRPSRRVLPPPVFYTLQGGLRELVDGLIAAIPQAARRAEAEVVSLTLGRSGLDVGLGSGDVLTARAVVLAVPAPQAARLLQRSAPDAATTLSSIPFASSAVVILGFRREHVAHPLDGYGLLIPRGEGLRTSACSFLSTKFPGRAPDGHVLLRGFLGGVRDPRILELDDGALVETVRREMGPVLGLRGEPVLRRVYRWPNATPQLELGHLERVAAVDARAAEVPGLFLTGAGLRATGLPDTIADAQRLADEVARFLAYPR